MEAVAEVVVGAAAIGITQPVFPDGQELDMAYRLGAIL